MTGAPSPPGAHGVHEPTFGRGLEHPMRISGQACDARGDHCSGFGELFDVVDAVRLAFRGLRYVTVRIADDAVADALPFPSDAELVEQD